MLWTTAKRISKSGFVNFWRSGLVSMSAILVMIVALSMIGSSILMSAFMKSALENMEDKIDVNVYMTLDAPEDEIIILKESLERLPEVKGVVYISREQALIDFRERHKNDQLTLQALDEIETNPLRAVLNVKAKEASQYASIAQFLDRDSALSLGGATIIDKVNYTDNKVVIDRLSQMITGVQKLGFVVILVMVLISIFITLNTIRLVIYISREEISVMKLVGADPKYIRGPFIVEGVMYGILAALITIGLFYPVTLWVKNATGEFYGGIDLFKYYINNFNQILLILVVSGILLGATASFLAVRRYLKN